MSRLDFLAAQARAAAFADPWTRVEQRQFRPLVLAGDIAVAISLNR